MLWYSVQVSVEEASFDEWLQWMREVHIPDVLASGHFTGAVVNKLSEPAPQPGTIAVDIHYEARSADAFETYRRECAPALQREHTERYEGRFKASRRIAEVLQRFNA